MDTTERPMASPRGIPFLRGYRADFRRNLQQSGTSPRPPGLRSNSPRTKAIRILGQRGGLRAKERNGNYQLRISRSSGPMTDPPQVSRRRALGFAGTAD